MACLLNHRFEVERYRQSRAWDPIVGVSFTGLFDFFVHAFGTTWLMLFTIVVMILGRWPHGETSKQSN